MIHTIPHYTDSQLTVEKARDGLGENPIVVARYTNKNNTQSVLHSHSYYELILPLSGDVLYSSGGSLYHLHPGELIIFPDENFHYGKYRINGDVSDRLLCQIDGDFLRSLSASISRRRQTQADEDTAISPIGHNGVYDDSLPGLSRRVITLSAPSVSEWDIRGLFQRMTLTSNYQSKKDREEIFRAQLTELLFAIRASQNGKAVKAPVIQNDIVGQAVSYLQQNYASPDLTVAQLAEHTFVSREHLSRLFKKYTMESIHCYLTELRIQHFKTRIMEGMGILEACADSGFSDYSSFTRAFRKLHGINPTEYRRQLFQE